MFPYVSVVISRKLLEQRMQIYTIQTVEGDREMKRCCRHRRPNRISPERYD